MFVSAANQVTFYFLIMQYDHTKRNFCKLMHNIMFAICGNGPTASSPWLDAVDFLQFY